MTSHETCDRSCDHGNSGPSRCRDERRVSCFGRSRDRESSPMTVGGSQFFLVCMHVCCEKHGRKHANSIQFEIFSLSCKASTHQESNGAGCPTTPQTGSQLKQMTIARFVRIRTRTFLSDCARAYSPQHTCRLRLFYPGASCVVSLHNPMETVR